MRLLVLAAALWTAVATRGFGDRSGSPKNTLIGQRRSLVVQDPVPAPTPASDDPLSCDEITDVSLRGQNWTDIVKTVCTNWPESMFGSFPVSSVDQLTDVLQGLFNEGGVWDQMSSLLGDYQDLYCLRDEVSRTTITSMMSARACPPVLDDDLLDEMPEVRDDGDSPLKVLTAGYWACMASGADACACRRRDVRNFSNPVVTIASRPSGCAMVQDGICYGDCPYGYRPTFLTGWFRPVCTSVCGATNHPVACGVGCAVSMSACASVILSQVREVAIAASKVAAFLTTGTAGLLLAQTVEQVARLAEFAFNILSKVLQAANTAYTMFRREQAEMATLVAIYQVIQEAAIGIGQDWAVFQPLIRDSASLFLQLIDANFGWASIDLGWISGVVMQNGLSAITGAFEVARTFAYGKCEVADDVVAFSVEPLSPTSYGDDRLIGPWSQDGSVNGKPRYRNMLNRDNVMLEWSSRDRSWSVWVRDTTFGRGWWFGWAGLGWRELYEARTDTPTFPTTGWLKLEGSLPLPLLVSTSNGGI